MCILPHESPKKIKPAPGWHRIKAECHEAADPTETTPPGCILRKIPLFGLREKTIGYGPTKEKWEAWNPDPQ